MHRIHIKIITLLCLVLFLQACTEEEATINSSLPPLDLSQTYAYKASSPFKTSIVECIKTTTDYSCDLQTLPLIGMENSVPDITTIMERVVVSHDWMGQRFEEILSQLPSEILPLFKAVTAIIIDSNIRPSFYTTETGAIYIDPRYLWLSVAEKQTINTAEDYRSSFSDPLKFKVLNRYLINDARAYQNFSLTDTSTRDLNDIELAFARLMLHELAHANDFIPVDSYTGLSSEQNVIDAVRSLASERTSNKLSQQLPLSSETLISLAGVMYKGYTPTPLELELTALEVGKAFDEDGASDDYGYTSIYEDTAMLFEATMMKYLYNADYEIAFTGIPQNPDDCHDYLIDWGVTSRLGDVYVKPRAELVASELLPNLSLSTFFQDLELPISTLGDWCITSATTLSRSKSQNEKTMPINEFIKPYL